MAVAVMKALDQRPDTLSQVVFESVREAVIDKTLSPGIRDVTRVGARSEQNPPFVRRCFGFGNWGSLNGMKCANSESRCHLFPRSRRPKTRAGRSSQQRLNSRRSVRPRGRGLRLSPVHARAPWPTRAKIWCSSANAIISSTWPWSGPQRAEHSLSSP